MASSSTERRRDLGSSSRKRKRLDFDEVALPLEAQDDDDKLVGNAETETPSVKKKRQRGGKKAKKPGDRSSSGPRFTIFVGNLPFSATNESLMAHFAAYHPIAARCLQKKEDPSKCRGCAFVDFDTGSHMRTCLDKMHNSTFIDPATGKSKVLNLELTAGGGGNSKTRMDKLKEKNRALNLNRARRQEVEREAKKSKGEAAAGEGEAAAGEGAAPGRDNERPKRRKMVSRDT